MRSRGVWQASLGLGVLHFGDALYDQERRIESCRIYGNINEYAYYYIDLLVGTPPQRVSVIADTGSHLAAFPCRSCKHCGRHLDPGFDLDASSTAKWIGCEAGGGCLGNCQSGHCTYKQSYTEGSSISGAWFTDRVSIGDALQHNPAVDAKMGCHKDENHLFYTQKANGILGLSPNPRGQTLLETLFADREHIQSHVFALCLAEWGGRLVVGGWNESYHTGEIGWTDLDIGGGYYNIMVSGMSVDGRALKSLNSNGWSIVDSGTTYVYMGRTQYQELRGAIESYCATNGCGAKLHGDCFVPDTDALGLADFPTITVFLGEGLVTTWGPNGYLFRTHKRWCYAFMDDGPGAATTLGTAWMMHHEIIFDLHEKKVGIVQAKCPEYRKRPALFPGTNISLPPLVPRQHEEEDLKLAATSLGRVSATQAAGVALLVLACATSAMFARRSCRVSSGVRVPDCEPEDALQMPESSRARCHQVLRSMLSWRRGWSDPSARAAFVQSDQTGIALMPHELDAGPGLTDTGNGYIEAGGML